MIQSWHMSQDVLKLFTSLGLSESETKVYFAGLKLGPTTVQAIAKKARLSRTATYDAVASLQDRGLMSTFESGKKRYFAVEDPERAVSYFKDSFQKMRRKLEILDEAIPELKLLAGGEKPAVRFYEGTEALFAVFDDVKKVQPKEMREVTNYTDVYAHLDMKMLTEARKSLDPRKTKVFMLHWGEPNPRNSLGNYCAIPKEVGEFHGDIWIYDNRVVFVTFIGKIVTVIIESESFARTAKSLFDMAWMAGKMREAE